VQNSYLFFSSILTFDFDLILGSFLLLGPNGIFLCSMWGSKTVLGSTHVVEQLSFSMLPSILTFYFDSILASFFIFGALMGYFGVREGLKSVLGSTYVLEQL